MSSASRGRGRGRGLARPSSSRELSPPSNAGEDQAAASSQAVELPHSMHEDAPAGPSNPSNSGPASQPGLQRASSVAVGASGGPTLLRKNVYTGNSKMRFVPNMVKRKVQPVAQVKEEEVEPSLADPFAGRGSGRGRGRGRGRGEAKDARGRGRGATEMAMTATGAFGYGPAQQERVAKRTFGPSTGWGGGGGGGGPGGASGSYGGGGGGTTSTAALVDSDPEDYGDAEDGDVGGGRRNKTVDLYDIGAENEMAPLVLPRDEKKWQEEEKLRKENEKAMAKLRLGPGSKAVKMDPYEEEELASASLAGTPTASASATPAPTQDGLEEAAPIEDAAVLGAEDVKITVKKENISPYFDLPPEDASHEQFYIFQFPRLFPQFAEPGLIPDIKPDPTDVASAFIESKHKVRSAYHESEAEAWRDYIPGRWQGWGKNPGREGREVLGAAGPNAQAANQPHPPEGRIGKIKVRRSGRTTLKLGGIEYEILPGAPANFLQEVAVLEDRKSNDDGEQGMFVMGQASKKFVITPELGKLLQQDAKERAERARLAKEEEEIRAKKMKEEELEKKMQGQASKAKRPLAKPAPRPKPGTAPSAAAAARKPTPTTRPAKG